MAYKFINEVGLSHILSVIKNALSGKSDSNHTHKYAGSSSVGGSATSAEKLTSNAGSATQPIYFSGGVPVVTTHSLNASVPSNAKFTDTTYGTATASVSGITKLYTGVGTNADGTMTQKAISEQITLLTNAIAELQEVVNNLPSTDSLATVATTGSYKDLVDLPTKLNEVKDY